MKNSINIDIFTNFNEILSLQQEWDDFIEKVNGGIFMTFDWLRIWCKYYCKNRKLRIMIFRKNEQIIGILPIVLENLKIGHFMIKILKIAGTDHLPITINIPVKETYFEQIFHLFSDYINIHLKWDIIYIGAISGRYETLDILVQACKNTFLYNHKIYVEERDKQTFFEINNTWEEFIQKLTKNERKKFRRIYKEIDNLKLKLHSNFVTEITFNFFWESFYNMHQERWRSVGKAGHFEAWPSSRDFHREVSASQIKHNRLRFLEVRLNEQPIGYKYCYKFGDTYFSYLEARSSINITNLKHINFPKLIFSEQIKRAMTDDIKWIDSMRGQYQHKLNLSGNLFPINHIYIYPAGIYVQFKIMIFRSLVKIINISYYRLWHDKISPLLRLNPKPLWKFWIKYHMFSN